jgi:hypothetical protein
MATTQMPRRTPGTTGAPPLPTLPRRQRRTGFLALAAALVALFAVGNVALFHVFSATKPVIGLADGVRYGQVVTAQDLVEMTIPTGGSTNALDWALRDSVIGKYATVDLQAGQLLPSGVTAPELTPAAGTSLVAVGVGSALLPAAELAAGDSVRIVAVQITPGSTPADPTNLPRAIAATVYSIAAPDRAGVIVVSVVVKDSDADTVVRLSAVGQAALVLIPRG